MNTVPYVYVGGLVYRSDNCVFDGNRRDVFPAFPDKRSGI